MEASIREKVYENRCCDICGRNRVHVIHMEGCVTTQGGHYVADCMVEICEECVNKMAKMFKKEVK